MAMVIAAGLAANQTPTVDPYDPPALLTWTRFCAPIEFNAAKRLPAIESDLNAIYADPTTNDVWVVGDAGTFLHSTDSGSSWTQLKIRYPSAAKSSSLVAPGSKWSIIPSAEAAQAQSQKGPPEIDPKQLPRELLEQNVASPRVQAPVANSKAPLKQPAKVPPKAPPAPESTRAIPQPRERPSPDNEDLAAVHFTDPQHGKVVGRTGVIMQTADGGEIWSISGYVVNASSNNTVDAQSWENETWYLRLRDGSYAISHDAGVTTVPASAVAVGPLPASNSLKRPEETPVVFYQPDKLRGWSAGDKGLVLHTTDGGTTWFHQTRELGRLQTGTGSYKRLPAPWFYFTWLVAALILLRPPEPRVSGKAVQLSVADMLMSDRPLEPGAPDPLDFRSLALGLSRFLRNVKTEPPLTIAITGEWGMGKSSLMNLLQSDLKDNGFRPVWFNAWHHQKEEHLLASLLQNIRLQAVPEWWNPGSFRFRFELLMLRLKRDGVPVAILSILLAFLVGNEITHGHGTLAGVADLLIAIQDSNAEQLAKTLGMEQTFFGALLLLVGMLGGAWRAATAFGVNPANLLATTSRGLGVRDLDAQTSFRYKFANEFREVTAALKNQRMVIFIDDLDRCRPEQVLDVLEAVNFLVSSGDCYVIFGMARERVEQCVGERFKDLAGNVTREEFARQYLDKLINIEVPIPLPKEEDARSLLVMPTPEPTPTNKTAAWRLKFARLVFVLGIPVGLVVFSFLAGRGLPNREPAAPTAQNPYAWQRSPAATAVTLPNPAPRRPGSGLDTPPNTAPVPDLQPREPDYVIPPYYSLMAIGLLFITGSFYWVLTSRRTGTLKDSPAFATALGIWHQVVFAKHRTPRALKRFVNRVRYMAMRQRQNRKETMPRWKLIAMALGWKPAEAVEESATGPNYIPEPELVALAAMHHMDPKGFESRGPFPVEGILKEAIKKHEEKFGKSVDLLEHRATYLRMVEGIRVN
jgi:hypothetical protein